MTGVTGGICEGKDTKRRYFAEDVRYALIHAENGGLVRTIGRQAPHYPGILPSLRYP